MLLGAGAIRAFVTAPADERGHNRRIGLRGGGLILCAVIGLSGAWIVIVPGGDHPLLALVETAVGPERFMTPRERTDYLEAAGIERRHKDEVDRLYALERQSRWQGDELTDDQVRRTARCSRP